MQSRQVNDAGSNEEEELGQSKMVLSIDTGIIQMTLLKLTAQAKSHQHRSQKVPKTLMYQESTLGLELILNTNET